MAVLSVMITDGSETGVRALSIAIQTPNQVLIQNTPPTRIKKLVGEDAQRRMIVDAEGVESGTAVGMITGGAPFINT